MNQPHEEQIDALPAALYVVATPIGNLDDITLRALQTLKSVDYIAAEDTRHTQRLLTHYAIRKPLWAIHDHNESQQIDKVIAAIQAGKSIALVSDAGTPLISDPGFTIVRALRQQQIAVITIPGPSAVTAALSIAGLPCQQFVFEGFLPAKKAACEARLQQLKSETRTQVFYASVHRVLKDVSMMAAIYGEVRSMVLLRELTKRHETAVSGTIAEIQRYLTEDANALKGEFVLVVAGCDLTANDSEVEINRILQLLLPSVPLKQAVQWVSDITGAAKNLVYERALQLQK